MRIPPTQLTQNHKPSTYRSCLLDTQQADTSLGKPSTYQSYLLDTQQADTSFGLSLRFFGILCLLGSWLLLAGCGNIGNRKFRDGFGGIQGTTLSPESKPVPYATVLVVNYPSLKVRSGKDGRFVLTDIPSGRRELLMYDGKGLGVRMSVWVVKDRLASIPASQTTLLPTAVLLGRITAPPRLTNQGIQIQIAGTDYRTSTHNVVGDFLLQQLAAGCHTLLVKTPLFKEFQKEEVCVTPGDKHVLPKVITLLPKKPCQSSSQCNKNNICEKNFCVPEGPGQAKILQPEKIFKDIKLQEEKTQSFDVLKNVGKGPLTIEEVAIEGDRKHFILSEKELPSLPHTLAIGETLKLSVTFRALSFQKEYRALLQIKTNDPKSPKSSVSLSGIVATKDSDCLKFDRTMFAMGDRSSRTIPLTTNAYNRCGEPIAVGSPISSKQPPPGGNERCTTSVWGSFSIPTCVTTPSNAAVVIPPGESRTLKWYLQAQGFGHFEGKLRLVYSEPKRKDIQVEFPIRAYINAPGLTITPRVLEFGAVAPQSKITLWMSLHFAKAASTNRLHALKTKISASTSALYKVLSTRLARTPVQTKTYYLPVQFTVPYQSSIPEGKLTLLNLSGLQGLPYYIPVRGAVATPQTPIFPTTHWLGATEVCTPPTHPLYITNPSSQPVTVSAIKLQTAASNPFVLKHGKLPLTLPPYTRLQMGTIQWKATSSSGVRTLAQLQITTHLQKQAPQILVTSLRAQTGFWHYDTYIQPKTKKLNILVFVDQKTEDLTDLGNGMTELLKELKRLHVKAQLEYSIHIMRETSVALPITPSTRNAEAELLRILQASIINAKHHGLETMASVRKVLHLPNQSSHTVALFFSQNDDLSPYEVSSYSPKSSAFTLFSAIPLQNCKAMQASYRYSTVTRQNGGASLDLCQARKSTWKSWFTQIKNTLLGQRRRFSLQQRPAPETIQVQVTENGFSRYLNPDRPNRDWNYDPTTNQIILLDYQLPQGAQISISYYTSCK